MPKRSLLLTVLVWLSACGAASGSAAGSGITGRVVEAPTCPVERVPPLPQCAPRPLSASIRVHRSGVKGSARIVHSAASGAFRLTLAPGTYVIQALPDGGSPFPRPPAARTVRVRAGHLTHVTITYDTGIR